MDEQNSIGNEKKGVGRVHDDACRNGYVPKELENPSIRWAEDGLFMIEPCMEGRAMRTDLNCYSPTGGGIWARALLRSIDCRAR